MHVHVLQVTGYDRDGRWQIPPSWAEARRGRSTRRLAGAPWGLHSTFGGGRGWQGRPREARGAGLGLDGLASRHAGGGSDGEACWKVPAVGEAAEPAEAFVSRCAMGPTHGVRRRSRLASRHERLEGPDGFASRYAGDNGF